MNQEERKKQVADEFWKLRIERDMMADLLKECAEGIEDMINSGEILQEPMMHELLAKLAPFVKK